MANAILTVTRADNEVAAYVNGVQVYDKKTENNPAFNDVIELDAYLAAGLNALVLVGVNWGGPCTFSGTVQIGKVVQPFSYTANSTPNGIVWTQTFAIPK